MHPWATPILIICLLLLILLICVQGLCPMVHTTSNSGWSSWGNLALINAQPLPQGHMVHYTPHYAEISPIQFCYINNVFIIIEKHCAFQQPYQQTTFPAAPSLM